eukprot:8328903-Alexandrium_andersonii.AAC.1
MYVHPRRAMCTNVSSRLTTWALHRGAKCVAAPMNSGAAAQTRSLKHHMEPHTRVPPTTGQRANALPGRMWIGVCRMSAWPTIGHGPPQLPLAPGPARCME